MRTQEKQLASIPFVDSAGTWLSVVHPTYKLTWRTSPSSSTWYLVVSFTTLLSLCLASFSRSYKECKKKKLSTHLGSQLGTHVGLAQPVSNHFSLYGRVFSPHALSEGYDKGRCCPKDTDASESATAAPTGLALRQKRPGYRSRLTNTERAT